MSNIFLMENDKPELQVDITPILQERLKRYDDLNLSEQFAMFMGKTQILELGLKRLLARKFGKEMDEMERWTLGKIRDEPSKTTCRPDFVELLGSFVGYRNYIAHELLANDALMRNLIGDSWTKEWRMLAKGVNELEHLIIWYDLCEEHNGWE